MTWKYIQTHKQNVCVCFFHFIQKSVRVGKLCVIFVTLLESFMRAEYKSYARFRGKKENSLVNFDVFIFWFWFSTTSKCSCVCVRVHVCLHVRKTKKEKKWWEATKTNCVFWSKWSNMLVYDASANANTNSNWMRVKHREGWIRIKRCMDSIEYRINDCVFVLLCVLNSIGWLFSTEISIMIMFGDLTRIEWESEFQREHAHRNRGNSR